MKLNAKQLREVGENEVRPLEKRSPLYFILENIYDTYNIGGIFRLADALNVSKIYLCGETEIPPNSKIQKASIGTYKIVPWEYKSSSLEAIRELRTYPVSTHPSNPLSRGEEKGCVQIIAVEQDVKSVEYTKINYQYPVALLVGNETYGVLPETLKEVDAIAEIPMFGVNRSLNVIVSLSIVAYRAMMSSTMKF